MSDRRLPGSEKYQRAPERTPAQNKVFAFIDRVNEDVSITQLFRDEFNLWVPDDISRSWKTYCPWAWEHPDGGIEKTLRVYASNTAYCFAFHGMLTPIKAIQIQKECSALTAARWLAERYGLEDNSRPYWERMKGLVLERETRTVAGGSLAYAAEALHRALSQVEGFADREFDEDVVAAIDAQLQRLDELEVHEGAIRAWLRDAVAKVTSVVA